MSEDKVFVSERIVNIGELLSKLSTANIMCAQLQKQLNEIVEFEIIAERVKTVFRDESHTPVIISEYPDLAGQSETLQK